MDTAIARKRHAADKPTRSLDDLWHEIKESLISDRGESLEEAEEHITHMKRVADDMSSLPPEGRSYYSWLWTVTAQPYEGGEPGLRNPDYIPTIEWLALQRNNKEMSDAHSGAEKQKVANELYAFYLSQRSMGAHSG
jgi:hypothetical protein